MNNPVMIEAVKAAGLAPSLKERVWRHVKDNPGKSATQIANALHSSNGGTSSTLYKLEVAGYVYSRINVVKGRKVSLYYTDLTSFNDPSRVPSTKPERQPQVRAKPQAKPQAATPATDSPEHGVALHTMTIGQLRSLVEDIRRLVGSLL